MAHPIIVFTGTDFSKHKFLDISHLLEMFFPNIRPHLLARKYRGCADSIKIKKDELSYSQTELL